MVRIWNELNKLEQVGLVELLKQDGWSHCTLSGADIGTRKAMTKTIKEKHISVELEHFHVDED